MPGDPLHWSLVALAVVAFVGLVWEAWREGRRPVPTPPRREPRSMVTIVDPHTPLTVQRDVYDQDARPGP